MRRMIFAGCAALAACSSGDAAPAPPIAGDDLNPVVVELYQSQGCSSCPPANANLNAIAGRKGVLALSFAVTYWDQLGWKDQFAKPQYTQRQWDFANTSGRGNVATPQVIVNGSGNMTGADRAHFARLLAVGGPKGGPAIGVDSGGVTIGARKGAKPATVWLVRYDPRTRNVAIRAGENGGRTLPHRNIVTELRVLGPWSGAAAKFAVSSTTDKTLLSAILVQQGKGGPIVAARKL
ncbi:DUF1223 domain-containing protein [Sphingomonas sp.]|uniref:DUF1223 domain-containing protein n=1 Tax=Sphingomonas sp. TaxID=28214 RepID=UPI00286C0B05|nr:DUF1223 domain-containing protein [Sphingomonas sp.]